MSRFKSGHSELATTLFRVRLFLGSYAPLFVILAVRFERLGPRIAAIALAIVGTLSMAMLVFIPRRHQPVRRTLSSISNGGDQVAGYLATYLLPFVTATDDTKNLVAVGIYLVITLVVYVRSEMIAINPTLILMGWKIMKVRATDGYEGFLLTRHRHEPGDVFGAVDLDRGVLLEASD